MHRRVLVLALAALALVAQGNSCTGEGQLVIVSPAAGVDVTTFSFPIQVNLAAGVWNVGTLDVQLNGVPVVMSGGPTVFTATQNPGAPLLDSNLLEVRIQALNGSGALVTRSFDYLPPNKAKLRKITNPADLLCGPLAHGRVGDYLLENGVARFVVQDVAKRDMHSIGTFGGNLIDAELVGTGCRENFFEVQPSPNIETVINAQTAQIVNDGQDGTPAILRTCGPDDLMDYVNPSGVVAAVGANFPPGVDDLDMPIEGCTEYVLEPGQRYVALNTTIENLDVDDLPLYLGDYINGMGELEQWTPPSGNTNPPQVGIGEMTATLGNDVFSYIGFGEAEGVDYALISPKPPVTPQPSTSFTQSGVSFVLHGQQVIQVLFFAAETPFVAPGNGSLTFGRHFAVGNGSGSNAVAVQLALAGANSGTLKGCVTVGGAPAPGARVSAGVLSTGLPNQGPTGSLRIVRGQWVTDANGCYEGKMPTGNFGVAASRTGAPFEAGAGVGCTAFTGYCVRSVSITNGGTTVQNFALPATGRLHVNVVDENSLAVPARVSVVGFDPSPEPVLSSTIVASLGAFRTNVFHDNTKDPVPFGLARVEYAGANGMVEFDMEPGSYQVFVSRGTEYSAFNAPVTVTAGSTATVNAQIAKVIATPGFISSDYHVHAIDSPDSRINLTRRVMQFAGEGVDNIIQTDHDAHTDLTAKIASLSLTPFVHSTIGEEITTFEYGHYNAYPLGLDTTRPSRGSTDHGKAEAPGTDFPSNGNYLLTPAQIHAAVLAAPHNTAPNIAVQINHIDSHFDPLRIDTAATPPQSFVTPAQKLALRLDPASGNLFHAFPALEVWNGFTRGQQNEFLVDRIGIWMNLLNHGIKSTAIADTDTHEYFNTRGGGARTWTPSSTDAPAAISDDEMAVAILNGRAVGGQGVYVQSQLSAASTGETASFALAAPTMAKTTDGAATLQIEVRAPIWAPYDRIEIYANAQTTVASTNGGTPTLYGAIPTQTFDLGGGFTRSTVNPYPAIPGAQYYSTSLTVPIAGLVQDTWYVVIVKGRAGVSQPMFPVMPTDLNTSGNTTLANLLDGNLNEGGVLALGNTNALYLDVDGNGVFDGPGPNVAP